MKKVNIKSANQNVIIKGVLLFIMVVCSLVLCACNATSLTTDEQAQTKDPLTQAQEFVQTMNSVSSEISQKAQDYSKALGEGDSVNAKVAMSAIGEALDKVQDLEAPDEIKDEANNYKNACASLKDALLKLNDVATETIENKDVSGNGGSVLTEAQNSYDKAVQDLKDADASLKEKAEQLKSSQIQK